jgi:hypothetical protein
LILRKLAWLNGERGLAALERTTDVLISPHNENFPDPTMNRQTGLRVWYAGPGGGLLISVATLREAKLVLKTMGALTGHVGPTHGGLQWCASGQGWTEWRGGDGETIHDVPDDDVVFTPPELACAATVH